MLLNLVTIIFTLMLTCILIASYVIYRLLDRLNKTKDDLLQLALDKGYFTKKALMRRDEAMLYVEMEKYIRRDLVILPQVPLSQIIDVKNGYKDHDNLFNELNRRTIDFCILDAQYNPICIIELNGASHFYENRQNRDKVVEHIAKNSSIDFIAISKNEFFRDGYLRERLEKYCA